MTVGEKFLVAALLTLAVSVLWYRRINITGINVRREFKRWRRFVENESATV